MSNFPKGSEWRLWDLHIHTPASYNYSGGRFATMSDSEKAAATSQIIANMNESEVAAFAINDYWTFDGYLCLKLATQAFTQPLIFDQPEDDLDNEFIIEELVDIFRGIKQFRQVILVSHNANLVVNADADQVIVAKNDAGVLRYTSGSLEDPATNQAVRRILEGGDAAFLKRELRHNLK